MLANKLLQAINTVSPLGITVISNSSVATSDVCSYQFGTIAISVSGGRPPYTYLWSKVSGEGGDPLSPTNSGMTASVPMCPGDTKVGLYEVTVQDTELSSITQQITLTWERFSFA